LEMQLAKDEPRRVTLHLVPQCLLFRQHAPGWSANGAVIQVRAAWVEEPAVEHRATESGHGEILETSLAGVRANVRMDRNSTVEYQSFLTCWSVNAIFEICVENGSVDRARSHGRIVHGSRCCTASVSLGGRSLARRRRVSEARSRH